MYLKKKAYILSYLANKGINDIAGVGKVINNYLKRPNETLMQIQSELASKIEVQKSQIKIQK